MKYILVLALYHGGFYEVPTYYDTLAECQAEARTIKNDFNVRVDATCIYIKELKK